MQANQSSYPKRERRSSQLPMYIYDTIKERDTTQTQPPIKKQKVEIENLPKSIFELGNPDCHEAVVLSNQEAFKSLQTMLTQALNAHFTEEDRLNMFKQQKQATKKSFFYIDDNTIVNDDTEKKKPNNLGQQIEKIANDIINSDSHISGKYDLVSKQTIQIGTKASDALHKDNGHDGYHDLSCNEYDYNIVIPIMNYNLLNPNNHDYAPESTKIIPQKFKKNIINYDKKKTRTDSDGTTYDRMPVFYPKSSKEEEKYLVSEKLTQGTALILHTATKAGSDDDGKSVIHISPETPLGYLRCFTTVRANKKL
jgi:hypothetical protein